jgi:hypothetical protein
VEERHTLDAMLRSFVEICSAREGERILRNAPNMSSCLGVVGIDCVKQAFQSGSAESLERHALAALPVIESARRGAGEK